MYYQENYEDEKSRLRACLRRLGTEEFRPLIRYLERTLAERIDTLSNAVDTATIYRMQGQCHAIKGVLEAVHDAQADRKVGA